jgi:CDP-glucose 4,6-dehydratase
MAIRRSSMEVMGIDLKFWQGKSVFITGHTGFKGSWLSLWLNSLGAKVTGFALAPETSPNLFQLAKIENDLTSIIGDIRDLNSLQKAMDISKPEIVIHMAAQPIVRYSYENPIETYQTNVMGTAHLLEAVRHVMGVRAVVIVTSDKCYDNQEKLSGYKEEDPMGGYDPYSNSKGCAELVTSSYRLSFFNPEKYQEHGVAIASARAGNVIGGGDWALDRLIPDFVRSMAKGECLNIRNPLAIRPWQHVLEPLSGYLILAQMLYINGSEFAEPWNFGPLESEAKNVEWIANELVKNWGDNASYLVEKNKKQAHEAHYLNLNSIKSRTKLHWSPQWDAKETIRRICNWHKYQINGENMKSYTLNEINEYQARISI